MTARPKTKIIERKVEFQGWRKLETLTVQHASLKHGGYAEPMTREIYHCGHVAATLLFSPKTDQILLNEQFRIGAFVAGDDNPWLYECCAGMVDDGEDPETTARREAEEETGSKVLDIEFIGKIYPSAGSSDEIFHLYCGHIAEAEAGHYGVESEGEEIKTHLFSAADALRMLETGEITNGATVIMLHWFARNHERLKKKWGGR